MRALRRFRTFGWLAVSGLAITLANAQSAAPPDVSQTNSAAALKLSARAASSPTAMAAAARSAIISGGMLPLPASGVPAGLEPFFQLSNSDIKFSFTRLTEILRDKKHEGWVLAAYPDPKTSRPLIGAGFTLDLPAREHQQSDPLNANLFLEPSSEQLWQAAGLDDHRLHLILDDYESKLETWGTRKYRKKIRQLPDQVSDDDALNLLRVAEVQAILNARAYCRSFDTLSGSQQMALAQLVYQMGVNLEEFSTFLALINQGPQLENAALTINTVGEREYWQEVQGSLIHSQWARKYSTRAITVIAMFDPDYAESPSAAEKRVKATLHPAKHHHKKSKTRSAKA
jgi:GH24 family phage-related lysozyme (muramidase)